MVLKISLPVIAVDEGLKWIARNYIESKDLSFCLFDNTAATRASSSETKLIVILCVKEELCG